MNDGCARRFAIAPAYGIAVAAAFAARVLMLPQFIASPFGYFHTVPGLDMKTWFDRADELANPDYWGNPYTVLIRAAKILFGSGGAPGAMIVLNGLCGICVALLAVWVARRFVRGEFAPAAAGVLAGLYAPAIVYEGVLLRESMQVLLSFAAFAGLLAMRRKHFSGMRAFGAGAALALPGIIRVSGMLFGVLGGLWMTGYVARRTRKWRAAFRTAVYGALGGIAVLGVMSIWNVVLRGECLPFAFNPGYSFAVGGQPLEEATPGGALSAAVTDGATTGRMANMARKFLSVFDGGTPPNNIHYTFIREKFPLLGFFIGPTLLAALGVWGLFLVFYERRVCRREGLIVLYVLAYAVPLALFMPLGRYKLVLYPAWCVLGALAAAHVLNQWRVRNRKSLIAAGLLLIAAICATQPSIQAVRASDFVTWGLAVNRMPEPDRAEAGAAFMSAYKLNPAFEGAALNYAAELFRAGRAREAGAVAERYLTSAPRHPGALYYAGLGAMARGDFAAARHRFEAIPPSALPGELETPRLYYLGESCRLSGAPGAARNYYRNALAREKHPERRTVIQNALDRLSPAKTE